MTLRRAITTGIALMGAAAGLSLAGCGGDAVPDDPAVVIGSKGFTESRVVAAAYEQALRRVGFRPVIRAYASTPAVAAALRSGAVDLYPEYTGSAWVTMEKGDPVALAGVPPTRQQQMVMQRLAGDQAVHAFAPAPGSNNAAAVCTRQSGLRSLADVQGLTHRAVIAATAETFTRPDAIPLVEKAYGFRITHRVVTVPEHRYDPIRSGRANCVVAYATDAEIKELGLVVLADPRRVVGGGIDYRLVALANRAWWDGLGDGVQARADEAISNVSRKMTTAWLRSANLRVVRGERPDDVALELVNVSVPGAGATTP